LYYYGKHVVRKLFVPRLFLFRLTIDICQKKLVCPTALNWRQYERSLQESRPKLQFTISNSSNGRRSNHELCDPGKPKVRQIREKMLTAIFWLNDFRRNINVPILVFRHDNLFILIFCKSTARRRRKVYSCPSNPAEASIFRTIRYSIDASRLPF
jgi:hypothetical protein